MSFVHFVWHTNIRSPVNEITATGSLKPAEGPPCMHWKQGATQCIESMTHGKSALPLTSDAEDTEVWY